MGDISRRAMLGATGGLIAGGLLKTQADAVTVGEAAPPQTAQVDPTKVLGAPTSVLGQRAPGEQPRRVMGTPAPTASSRTPLEQCREGLYSSLLSTWRRQREKGQLRALSAKKRGPKPTPDAALVRELAQLRQQNERLEKKLKKAEIIIEVQKKVSELLGLDLSEGQS